MANRLHHAGYVEGVASSRPAKVRQGHKQAYRLVLGLCRDLQFGDRRPQPWTSAGYRA